MTQRSTKIFCACIFFMSAGQSFAMEEFEPYDPLPEGTYFDAHDPRQFDFLDSYSVPQAEVLHPIELAQLPESPAVQPKPMPEEAHLLPEVSFQEPFVPVCDSHTPMISFDISTVRQLQESIVQLKKCIYDVHQKILGQEERFDRLQALVQSLDRLVHQVPPKIQNPIEAQAGPFYPSQEQSGNFVSRQSLKIMVPTVPVQQGSQARGSVYQQQHGSALYTLLRNRYLQVQREREQQAADMQFGLEAKKTRK
ncbi:MAG TPA: hypothetical protein PKD74_01450 [Candidatus Dependentiae bacterium]|nr:hypothetical protein [Candidatus Dependentiae bacterium]